MVYVKLQCVQECSTSLPPSSVHIRACTCMCIEVLADRFVQRLASLKCSLANINVCLEEYFKNRNGFSVVPLFIQHLQCFGELILLALHFDFPRLL